MQKNLRRHFERLLPAVRREVLIDAARKYIGRHGLRAVSLRAVAKEADVSVGLISYYFPDGIDGLLKAAFESAQFDRVPVVHAEPQTIAEALHNLREIINWSFQASNYSREDIRFWLAIHEEMIVCASLRKRVIDRELLHIEELSIHIDRIVKLRGLVVDARMLAESLSAFLNGIWLVWCSSERSDTEKERNLVYSFLESSLGPLRP